VTVSYSGGNKRKLSTAIALVGNPPIVFLDEPSTGMDPVSRRFMWNFISTTMKGRSVILTTHSMEECEALCHRLGIMVGGKLRCIGTPQHIKHRFGQGYQIDLNLEENQKDIAQVDAFIQSSFPGAKMTESHVHRLKYQIEARQPLGLIFGILENNRSALGFKEYSVGQTSLEQIFIDFAKLQDEEKGPITAFKSAPEGMMMMPPGAVVQMTTIPPTGTNLDPPQFQSSQAPLKTSDAISFVTGVPDSLFTNQPTHHPSSSSKGTPITITVRPQGTY